METVKRTYIYASSRLPKRGWFQACVMCDAFTSKIRLFKKEEKGKPYEIYTYLCNKCYHKLNDEEFKYEYNKLCNDRINKS